MAALPRPRTKRNNSRELGPVVAENADGGVAKAAHEAQQLQ
jgi:hypothetical protein